MALYLGLDCSTQSLKAIAIDDRLSVTSEFLVNFDADLPAFKTQGGVHRGVDGNPQTVTSPPSLWLAALDKLLENMKAAKFPFERVVSVSGSGQQHGSVYWKTGAENHLKSLQSDKPLAELLKQAFSVENSPIWMDSSTTKYCLDLESALGGAQRIASITGSRAYERFTGNQIAKVWHEAKANYEATERISLVSSFVASVLIGHYAPIDRSDASMNLLDIHQKKWSPEILAHSAPGLAAKLGEVSTSHTVVGKIAAYYQTRYGFSAGCSVVAFAGDNPNSVVGMRLGAGGLSISLGTSDTLFGILAQPTPSASEGHIFCNPADPDGYMALLCYKNGSLTREDVRDRVANRSWVQFNSLLAATKPGNDGHIGFFFKDAEITPQGGRGFHRFDKSQRPVSSFSPEVEVRAVVEGQFLSMRLHASNVGINHFTSLLATGGASSNKNIVQVAADVFGVPVYTAPTANSAALGAAIRALHGLKSASGLVPMESLYAAMSPFTKIAEPHVEAHKLYDEMLNKYSHLEKRVLGHGSSASASAPSPSPSPTATVASAATVGSVATRKAQNQARPWLDSIYEVIAKTVLNRAAEGLFTCKLRFEDLVAQVHFDALLSCNSRVQEPANQLRLQKLLATQNIHSEFRTSEAGVELRVRWGADLL